MSDPVLSGIVATLSRPGGNITGVSNFLPATSGKMLELLRQVAPNTMRVAILHNPTNAGKLLEVAELVKAGRAMAINVETIEVRSPGDFDDAFSRIVQMGCDGLVTLQEGVALGQRQRIAEFASKNRLPAIYQIREYVEAGGLMSYGLNFCHHFSRGAFYVDKILRGTKPADLPVELPTKFELVLNLKAAKSLGTTLPPSLLAIADDVIE